jgi:hypothetical protein
MRAGLRTLTLLAMLGAAQPGAVAEEAVDRFLVITAEGADSIGRKLRGPANDGYRIVGACQGLSLQGESRVVALMERSADPGEPVEFVALTVPGDLGKDGALRAVNELGAEGYRLFRRNVFARAVVDWWLPSSAYDDQVTLVMERSPDAARYRYTTVAYSEPEPFHLALDERRLEGFEVLGLWNTHRRPRVLMEKGLDTETETGGEEREPYRLIVRATTRGLKSALARYASSGYRILDSTDQAILAPPILMLERTALPSGTIEYKLVKQPLTKIHKEKLENKLNKRARNGYSVLPQSISGTMLILERERKGAPALEYRALSSKVSPGIPRAMADLTDRGYRFVAMFHGSDETTVLVGRPRERP